MPDTMSPEQALGFLRLGLGTAGPQHVFDTARVMPQDQLASMLVASLQQTQRERGKADRLADALRGTMPFAAMGAQLEGYPEAIKAAQTALDGHNNNYVRTRDPSPLATVLRENLSFMRESLDSLKDTLTAFPRVRNRWDRLVTRTQDALDTYERGRSIP